MDGTIDVGWEFYVRIYNVGAAYAWAKLTDEQRENWREIARDFLETCCGSITACPKS